MDLHNAETLEVEQVLQLFLKNKNEQINQIKVKLQQTDLSDLR